MTGAASGNGRPAGAEPAGAEPTRAEPTGVEPTGVEPTRAEPTGAGPAGEPGAQAVAVVAVTFSPGSSLTRFLESLALATDREVEVLLADNGSSDGAPEAAAQRPGVKLISTGGNVGYGRAANVGVAATSADWVVVANPDVVWDPGSLDALLAAASRWPRAGALGPLIRQPDGRVYPSARALPTLGRGIGHAVFGWFWPGNPWSVRYRRENQEPTERTAGWLSGSCLLLRRQAFESVGGFDPAYFMYFEDVDLGERLADAGWLNVYVPTAVVTHTGAHSTSRHAAAMTTAHHRSAWLYFSRHYPGLRWLPLRLAVRLGLAVREQLSLRVGSVSAGARPHGSRPPGTQSPGTRSPGTRSHGMQSLGRRVLGHRLLKRSLAAGRSKRES